MASNEDRDIIDVLDSLESEISQSNNPDPRKATLDALVRARQALEEIRNAEVATFLRHLRDVQRIDLAAPAPCPACREAPTSAECKLCRGSKRISNATYYHYLTDPDSALRSPALAHSLVNTSDSDVIPIERSRRM